MPSPAPSRLDFVFAVGKAEVERQAEKTKSLPKRASANTAANPPVNKPNPFPTSVAGNTSPGFNFAPAGGQPAAPPASKFVVSQPQPKAKSKASVVPGAAPAAVAGPPNQAFWMKPEPVVKEIKWEAPDRPCNGFADGGYELPVEERFKPFIEYIYAGMNRTPRATAEQMGRFMMETLIFNDEQRKKENDICIAKMTDIYKQKAQTTELDPVYEQLRQEAENMPQEAQQERFRQYQKFQGEKKVQVEREAAAIRTVLDTWRAEEEQNLRHELHDLYNEFERTILTEAKEAADKEVMRLKAQMAASGPAEPSKKPWWQVAEDIRTVKGCAGKDQNSLTLLDRIPTHFNCKSIVDIVRDVYRLPLEKVEYAIGLMGMLYKELENRLDALRWTDGDKYIGMPPSEKEFYMTAWKESAVEKTLISYLLWLVEYAYPTMLATKRTMTDLNPVTTIAPEAWVQQKWGQLASPVLETFINYPDKQPNTAFVFREPPIAEYGLWPLWQQSITTQAAREEFVGQWVAMLYRGGWIEQGAGQKTYEEVDSFLSRQYEYDQSEHARQLRLAQEDQTRQEKLLELAREAQKLNGQQPQWPPM